MQYSEDSLDGKAQVRVHEELRPVSEACDELRERWSESLERTLAFGAVVDVTCVRSIVNSSCE